MASGRVSVRLWLKRLLGWDAILPLSNALVPTGFKLLIPDNETFLASIAVGLPITLLFFRAQMGKCHIASNPCRSSMRRIQYCTLTIDILVLFCLDALIFAAIMTPQGLTIPTEEVWKILALLISIYLGLMTISTYPGRRSPRASIFQPQTDHWAGDR